MLGWFDLITLGIGCIIGTGLFVLTGVAARDKVEKKDIGRPTQTNKKNEKKEDKKERGRDG